MTCFITHFTELENLTSNYTTEEIYNTDYVKVFGDFNKKILEEFSYIPFTLIKTIPNFNEFTEEFKELCLKILFEIFGVNLNIQIIPSDNIHEYKIIFKTENYLPFYVKKSRIENLVQKLSYPLTSCIFSTNSLTYLVLAIAENKKIITKDEIIRHNNIWICNLKNKKNLEEKLEGIYSDLFKEMGTDGIVCIENISIYMSEILDSFKIKKYLHENLPKNIIYIYKKDLKWLKEAEERVMLGKLPMITIFIDSKDLQIFKNIYFNYLISNKYLKSLMQQIEIMKYNDLLQIKFPSASPEMTDIIISNFKDKNENDDRKQIEYLNIEGVVNYSNKNINVINQNGKSKILFENVKNKKHIVEKIQKLWDEGFFMSEWSYFYTLTNGKMSSTDVYIPVKFKDL